MRTGERIKYLREAECMTQTELAEKIGSTKQNVYKYENGIIANIPSDKIERIARSFGVSPGAIMGWESEDGKAKDRGLFMGLGKKLDEIIKSRNLKVMQVASMAGIPASTLYSIIDRDNKKIDIDILIRICKVLDISVEYLVGENSSIECTVSVANIDRVKTQILIVEQKLSELKDAIEVLNKMSVEIEIH